jgi:ubiquinone/menaquinone biosynthesis C-methylase UbiE
MDDNTGGSAQFRLDEVSTYLPETSSILDMSSGCGTFVFCALKQGFHAYGIEPEPWKNAFCRLKINERNYPTKWNNCFIQSIGEKLPINDNSFDCISTYQTLEHVQNIEQCIDEMLRVVKSDGGLHIRCPDYRSTYEGHYLLPWLPLMPKLLARFYLRLLRRPTSGLDTLTYTTRGQIERLLKKCARRHKYKIAIVNLNKEYYTNKLKEKHLPVSLILLYPFIRGLAYLRYLFKADLSVGLFVTIVK